MHGFAVVTAETAEEGLPGAEGEPFRPGDCRFAAEARVRPGRGPRRTRGCAGDHFSGVPSESSELERVRPRTRLIEKPYSLVLLIETLEEMLTESANIRS
jgi:hypothetical protein